jgi:hypothetical protein
MTTALESIAHLKGQIEDLQEHIRGDADRLKQQVDDHLDHPGGVRYIVELADRIKRDAGWIQKNLDEIAKLEAQRGDDNPKLKRTWEK